ncbi:DUF4282 domain-containing protein [Brucella intermedia]|uniref:DUF4282 domain-containing protein n=1 Tax=Brucella intermedia TaxID=94625 RepID=UPI00236040EE|nr:DUF4282 domain-containing protein [Brucella intermedia]
MVLKSFLAFDRFFTPILVKVGYWIGIVAIVMSFVRGVYRDYAIEAGVPVIIASFVVFILALIAWRVLCESFILAFKIYDRLIEIKEQTTPLK